MFSLELQKLGMRKFRYENIDFTFPFYFWNFGSFRYKTL